MYKTMVLELLQQRPQIHEQLRASRTLLSTMEQMAISLKSGHEEWKNHLRQSMASSSESEIANAAMELAIKELESVLSSVSPMDGDDLPILDQPTANE